ncbi:MAG TPA: hypothetical protein VMW46_13335 [Candidatus Desulfaltia sp.]|nr:hypothetical protein [Candidatus Desulfaltia sp.]
MKKTLIFGMVILVLTAPVFAGVVKKTKSDIGFRGFGKFSLVQSEKLTADQKWADMKTDFKGQGLTGGLAAKTILRSGDTGEITDLPASTVYKLDNKKKEYSVSTIEKMKEQIAGEEQEAREAQEEKEPAKSTIKITKNEFKVEDTGEESTINNFPVRKYLAHWLMEWEDTETGEKGSSRLETLVWTTPMSGELEKAREEEARFSKAYLEKIGISFDHKQEDILGTRWLAILDSFSMKRDGAPRDFSKAAGELQKIEGYPIVTDGKYFATSQKPAGESAEQGEETSKDVKGAIGGLLKKTLKKKPADSAAAANEPALTFHTEVLEISTPSLGASDFQVPANYKKKS